MAERWQPLVELAGASRELVALLVGEAWRGAGRPRSILNNDGVPLQLCISSSEDRLATRLIGDPHTAELDPRRRAEASVRSARAVLVATGAGDLQPIVDATIAHTLPAGGERACLHDGALWLAAAPGGEPGAAIYTTLDWGEPGARWGRVRTWLDAILPRGAAAWRELAPLADLALPVSAAIEGRDRHDARAKVYLRLVRPQPFAELGVPGLADASFDAFHDAVVGDRAIRTTGLVLSIGFAVATGERVDTKLDLCGHCTARPLVAWQALCARTTRDLGIQPFDLAWRADIDVAFVGIARRRTGATRCNLYVKARA